MVSVIVPVYNVADYLDLCMESIVNQTYSDLEILLINDGSTDRSGEICETWAQKDSRIKYVKKENEGLGATRTLGLTLAKGNEVMFVDSDDWLPQTGIQSLIRCMRKYDADLAAGSYFRYQNGKELEERKLSLPFAAIDSPEKKQVYIYRGFPEAWAKLYKRSLFLNHQIEIPDLIHEDCAVFPQLVYRSEKIGICEEFVYYYRINRPGSILQSSEDTGTICRALQYCIRQFQLMEISENYHECLKKYCERYVFGAILNRYQEETTKSFEETFRETLCFLNHQFPEWSHDKKEVDMYCAGSFSLLWMLKHAAVYMQEYNPHYIYQEIKEIHFENQYSICGHTCFSSITSLFQEEETVVAENENPFRKAKILEDWNNGLLYNLEKQKPDLIFIDFLEERYDLARLPSGKIVTLSEAFCTSKVSEPQSFQVIESGTEGFLHYWTERCQLLIAYLKKSFSHKQIILVKNRLAKTYYCNGIYIDYQEQEKIQRINEMLGRMYDYFEENFQGISVFELPEEWVWSSDKVKYGCSPEYYNGQAYGEMGKRLAYLECRKQVEKW